MSLQPKMSFLKGASFAVPLVTALGGLGACSAPAERTEREPGRAREAYASVAAVLLDFEFDGTMVTDDPDVKVAIVDQLFYTVGSLNGDNSVGRFERLELTNVVATEDAEGLHHVSYHAKMPVSWGQPATPPSSYTFVVPRDVSWPKLEAFSTTYGAANSPCLAFGAHDVDPGSMWYYFRPKNAGCTVAPADAVTFTATVVMSAANTVGKYPEYHEVWKDGALEVVAVFGKNEEESTSDYDAGTYEYNRLVALLKQKFADPTVRTLVPANVSDTPGVAVPEVSLESVLPDGRRVRFTLMLVSKLETADATFDARFNAVTPTADMVLYNGHAGLGANVRSLLRRGAYVPGKYMMLLVNGCDTFAYTDRSLLERRALLNPDDPTGTKYMDVMTNAMPGYFSSLANGSMTLINGMLSYDAPKTYQQMFPAIDPVQVIAVTGEEDNVFTPGMPIGKP